MSFDRLLVHPEEEVVALTICWRPQLGAGRHSFRFGHPAIFFEQDNVSSRSLPGNDCKEKNAENDGSKAEHIHEIHAGPLGDCSAYSTRVPEFLSTRVLRLPDAQLREAA